MLHRLPEWHVDGWGPWSADIVAAGGVWQLKLRDDKGGDPDEWPAGLRRREYPSGRDPA